MNFLKAFLKATVTIVNSTFTCNGCFQPNATINYSWIPLFPFSFTRLTSLQFVQHSIEPISNSACNSNTANCIWKEIIESVNSIRWLTPPSCSFNRIKSLVTISWFTDLDEYLNISLCFIILSRRKAVNGDWNTSLHSN